MKHKSLFLAIGILGITYGIGYIRGHMGARISGWCDRRAAEKYVAVT